MKINTARSESPAKVDSKQYHFTVVNAEDTHSKRTGNEMIKLMLSVTVNGQQKTIYDYLAVEWKIREFLSSVGRADLLNGGEEAEIHARDCVDLSGECSLKEEEYEGKTQIKVDKYIRASFEKGNAAITQIKSNLSSPPKAEEDSDFDDLPF